MNSRQLLLRFGADLSPLEKAVVQASKSVESFGKECISAGKALSAAITAPLVGLGAAAVAASESMAGAMNQIRNGTGETGAALDALGDTFKKVYGDLPVTTSDAAAAITELHTRLGLTGEALSSMSEQFLNLARVTGGDVATQIDSASKVFSSWGVAAQNQSATLDMLFNVSQKTGISVQSLSDELTQGGAALRSLGVPLDEAAALLGQFQKSGVDAGTAIAGLTRAAKDYAKSGVDMHDGLQQTISAITSASSAEDAARIASEAFGKSGIAMADAVRRGTFDVQGLLAQLRQSPDTINKAAESTRTLGGNFQILQNNITKALEPLGTAITDVLVRDFIPVLKVAADGLGDLVHAFAALPKPAQDAIIIAAGIAAAIGPALIALGGIVIAIDKVALAAISLRATAGAALASVGSLFGAAAPEVAAASAEVAGAAGLGGIAAIGAAVVESVGAIGGALLAFAASPVTLAVAGIALLATRWDWLRDKISTAASGILERTKEAATQTTHDMGVIADAVAGAGSKAAQKLGELADAVQAKLAKTRVLEVEWLNALSKAYNDWYAGLDDSTKAGLAKVLGQIQSFGSNVFNWVSDPLKTGFHQMAAVIESENSGIMASTSKMAASVESSAARAVKAVGSIFGATAQAANSLVDSALAAGRAAGGAPGGGGSGSPPAAGAGGGGGGAGGGSAGPPVGGGSPGGPSVGANVDAVTGYGASNGNPVRQNGSGATIQTVNPYDLPSTQGGDRGFLATRDARAQAAVNRSYPGGYVGVVGSGNDAFTTTNFENAMWGTSVQQYSNWSDSQTENFTPVGQPAQSNSYNTSLAGIPGFARGGVVTGPMQAMVGEAGPEAILPLSALSGMLSGAPFGQSGARGGGPGAVEIHVHIQGSVLSQSDLTAQVRRGLIGIQNRNSGTGIKT